MTPEEILKKEYPKRGQKKTVKESIADLESELSVALAQGNKRKVNSIKAMIKRIKRL